jgi:3-dehydroquinate synthase
MKKIKVKLGQRSYDIIVGQGTFGELPSVIKKFDQKPPVVVICDRTVAAKGRHVISTIIKSISNDVIKILVGPGERAKSLGVFADVVKTVASRTRKHRPVMIAIGGGVAGDLGGFVAATYRRGVPLIQVPTTLLAQVDSSVGGKTGIDLPAAKNLIGAFWQPQKVIIDTEFLKTLPRRHLSNGMAEVIKYGVIKSAGLFEFLEKNISRVNARKPEVLEKIISECVSIKAGVVEKDELDRKDIRIILNFGHTLGHAIETASGYSNRYNHGESVAVGMVMAGEIAVRLGLFDRADQERVKALLSKAGLPIGTRKIPLDAILKAYRYDKKFTSGENRFVLPRTIGQVKVSGGVPEPLIRKVIKDYAV